MKSTTLLRRRCACGQMFSQRTAKDVRCSACRPPKRLRVQVRDRSNEALYRFWLGEDETRWRRWLLAQLTPFLGQTSVNVNELILHLREQASQEHAA